MYTVIYTVGNNIVIQLITLELVVATATPRFYRELTCMASERANNLQTVFFGVCGGYIIGYSRGYWTKRREIRPSWRCPSQEIVSLQIASILAKYGVNKSILLNTLKLSSILSVYPKSINDRGG